MVTYTRDTKSCHNCGAAIPAQQPYPFCKGCEEQRRDCKPEPSRSADAVITHVVSPYSTRTVYKSIRKW